MNSLKQAVGNDQTDPTSEDDDLIPGTAFNRRQARMLKNAVITMGIMLVAGFALLIGIIAYRASQPAKPSPTIAPAGVGVPGTTLRSTTNTGNMARKIEALIPAGATYLDSTISGNRLVLTLQTPKKDLTLLIIDLNSWKITGEAHLKQDR